MPENNEEYKLKEEYASENLESPAGYIASEAEAEMVRKSPQLKLSSLLPFKNKKILVIALVIAAIIGGFQIIKIFSSKKGQKAEIVATEKTPAQSKVVFEASFSELMEKYNANKEKIASLGKQVSSIQDTMTALEKNVQDLNSVVEKLTKDVEQVMALQANLKITSSEYRIPQATSKPQQKIPYHVKAIVSGRAWLETNKGKIITVRPGSGLGSYGLVTQINEDNGTVTTSLGTVITYGINDI